MTGISETTIARDDDHALIEAGYKPQLKRSLGFFSSFAVSFSFMSVLMGIFANYGYMLGKAGPFGIWTWLLVGAGQLLVALVFAEMAGRIPLTGALYNWNNRLVNPTVGWFTAWLLFFAYALGYVGVVAAMFAPMQTFFGQDFTPNTIRVIGVGIFVMVAFINIYGVRLAAHTNKLAVAAELIALVVFGAIILTVILVHGEAHPALVTTIPNQPVPYLPGFLMATLLGTFTIFGFESPADLSEETVDVRLITPKSIIASILATILFGAGFLVIITLAIPDVAAATAAVDPISTIVAYHLGTLATKIFLIFVMVAMFASSIVGVTAASRILFAVARDKNILGSSLFAHVSTHHVPKAAIITVVIVQIIAFLSFQNVTDLYAAPVVILAVAYLVTVIGFIVGSKKLPPTSSFSLGRWHWPVVLLAVLWLLSEIAILTLPEESHTVAAIAGAIIAAGIPSYFITHRVHTSA